MHLWSRNVLNLKNAFILDQTSHHFKDVVHQMNALENNIKGYQGELNQYEGQIKNLAEELRTKNEAYQSLQLV